MSVRIGIDLGTTNSAAAMVYDDGPHLIPRAGTDRVFLQSVVWFRWKEGLADIRVGKDAVQANGRVVRSIKRLMGRTYDAAMSEHAQDHFMPPLSLERRLANDLRLSIEGNDASRHSYWPQEICALILKDIKRQAEEKLEVAVDGAVITVPAYFGDSHRAATLDAARRAGIRVLEPLIDEPSAAALAFARVVAVPRAEPLLVVDWGGGTLDVTVLMNDGGAWTQLRIDGDLNLGGDDIDRALAQSVLKRKGHPEEFLEDNETAYPLVNMARTAKELLSSSTSATFICSVRDPESLRTTVISDQLTRKDFEDVTARFVDSAINVVQRCLDSPDVPVSEIRKILLVGGSTFIPSFRQRLSALLPKARLHTEVDPMQVVALGAAIYAEMQAGDLLRMCPYGYAVKDRDGELHEVIPPDQDIPTPEHLPYKVQPEPETAYDGQTVYRLMLQPFSRISRGLKQLSPGSAIRVFGREFPPRPSGSKLECHLWLDVNKVVRARVRLKGAEETREMKQISGAETGPEALATELMDCCLEVEALLERNAGNQGPLLQQLRGEWERAGTLLNADIPEESEAVLASLRGLIDQISIPHTRTDIKAGFDMEERKRVLGWVSVFEQDMLPKYWPILDDEERKASIESIRRLRIMEETRAPSAELTAVFDELIVLLENMRIGPILAGYRKARVLGVPSRISDELIELCDQAEEHYTLGEQPAFRKTCEALDSKVKEANERWVAWRETSGVEIVSPDLVVNKANG